jgi:hypothetical protein
MLSVSSLDTLRAMIAGLTSIQGLQARIAGMEAEREAHLATIQGLQARIAEMTNADREVRHCSVTRKLIKPLLYLSRRLR